MAAKGKAKKKKDDKDALVSDEQRRRERIILGLFLVGAVFIVTGMFGLSGFLSGSLANVKDITLLSIMGVTGVVLASGILYLKFLGRKA